MQPVTCTRRSRIAAFARFTVRNLGLSGDSSAFLTSVRSVVAAVAPAPPDLNAATDCKAFAIVSFAVAGLAAAAAAAEEGAMPDSAATCASSSGGAASPRAVIFSI